MSDNSNTKAEPTFALARAKSGIAFWICRAVLLALSLLTVNVAASAQSMTLTKTICSGDASAASSCTFAGTPQIGDPVYYEIFIGNTYGSTTSITLEEDFPTGFVPVYPVSCSDPFGDPITTSVSTTVSPVLIQLDVEPSEDAVCRINGYFEIPGEVATNKVRGAGNTATEKEVTVVVDQDNSIPADLSITKTADTSGPIDLTNGPQSVTYTITVTTDNDVYLDDYFKIYDLLSLTSGSIPINANLVSGSANCSVTSPGGGGLTCPVTNDFSGNFPNEAWTSFISFGYGSALPILFRAGDVFTLSYTVEYSISSNQTCISAIDANGINNRAFLGLANGAMSLTDLNSVNNDTVNSGLNTVDVYVDLPVTDDCVSLPPTPPKPSPLSVDKNYTEHLTASGATSSTFPVSWDQQFVNYDITLTNTSSTEVVYDIDTIDQYSNSTYTPNHTVQLHSVDITSCPVSSVCSIDQPAGWVSGMPAPQGSVQAINSYYDSATMFKGFVDVLQPGESMTYTVKLILRDPSCDFAEFEQPKTVINSLLAPHKVDREDPFTSLMIPNNFTVGDSASIQVEKTQPCDFNVKKTILNAPNEVEFGQPMNYTIEFENGGEPIEAGTLLDVLRIEQQYYALGMDTSYSFSCVDNPSGSVVDFVPSGSGNGSVSYVQHPHQGLRVMDHPGFVKFAPYAKLVCNITATVQKPADSDPYCFSNGTPTLGNAAIIDGSLFYNTNQGWPLAPRGTMWDAVSSKLPKCYHLVVNKLVSPPTTTPNFGPNLTYTISVTNASGSGTAGDVDFPVTNPWTGPKFTDTFQTGPFPVAPPQNAPTFLSDNCTSSTPGACEWSWLTALSAIGHETGISKLPAGEVLSYTYEIPPSFTPHEICNDISGELLIDGFVADPERWYAKAPSTLGPKQACALIRTNLELTKTVDVHPTITLPPDTAFTVDINCTPPSGFNSVNMSQSFDMNNLVKTQPNVVVGSQCVIVEQTPDESLLPSHCDWNPPTYPDGDSFLADGSVEPHSLSVHNSMTCRFGDVRFSKSVEGNATELATGGLADFDFDLTCGAPASTTYDLSVPAAGSDIFLQIPDGSQCTLSETQPVNYTDSEGRICEWEAPEYSGSGVNGNTTTVSEGSVPHFIVKNKVHCRHMGDLTIRKLILATGSTPTVDPDHMFDASVSCLDSNSNSVYSGTVSASINTPNTISNIPTPSTCTVTEMTPSLSLLPEHCFAWAAPTYSPGNTATLPDEKGSSAEIVMINSPGCHTFGSIRVKKTLDPESAPLPAGTTFGYDMTCTDMDGVVTTEPYTISAGQTQSYTGYTTTNCVVTETLPAAPDYCTWVTPEYSRPSANFTTHSGIEIEMVNRLNCPTDEIEISKTFSDDTDYTPDGQIYDTDVSCSNGQDYSLDVLAGGTVSTVSIPQGVTCEVSETSPSNDILPDGCSWDEPRIEPSTVYVIEGQTNPVTVENNITCANDLTIEKTFEVPAGVDFNEDFEFVVEVSCDLPGGSTTVQNVTLSSNDSLETVTGLPLGAQCTIKEFTPADYAGLPDHCNWNKPYYPDGDNITLGTPGGSYELSVHNAAKCYYGEVKVEKLWAFQGSSTSPSGILYDVNMSCADGSSFGTTLDVGGTHTFTNVPADTDCTLTEVLPPYPYNNNCEWNSPSFNPSNPVQVSAGGTTSVSVTNSNSCSDIVINPGGGILTAAGEGDISIHKTPAPPQPGGPLMLNAIPAGATFEITLSCDDGTNVVYSSMQAGTGVIETDIPAGTVCTVTETPPDDSMLPGRCRWNAPQYIGANPVTILNNQTVNVDVKNSYSCRDRPPFEFKSYIDVEKVLIGASGAALTADYDIDVTCGNSTRTVSVAAGSSERLTYNGFFAAPLGGGTACQVTEAPPSNALLPDNCSWAPPSYSPSQGVNPGPASNIPTVTVTNRAVCTGGMEIDKELIVPAGLNLSSTPTFSANILCISPGLGFGGWSFFNDTISEGNNLTSVNQTSPVFCYYWEDMPTSALPAGCEWEPPAYPNGNGALVTPGNLATGRIVNEVLCQEGSFNVAKTFHPDSHSLGDNSVFQVAISCGAPINSTTVLPLDTMTTIDYDGLLGASCTVTELPPPDIDYCSWEPAQYITSFTSTIPASVETSLQDPTVVIQNKLVCDLPPSELEISKTLVSEEPCWDPTTGLFDCTFDITIDNVGVDVATGPFVVEETMPGTVGYIPPTGADNGWMCDLPVPNIPNPLGPLVCESSSSLTINGGDSTTFQVQMSGFSLYPPNENCVSIYDEANDDFDEFCLELFSPELVIEKILLTPGCAEIPTSECLFEVTVTNVGAADFNAPLIIQDYPSSASGLTSLPTNVLTQPAAPWICFPLPNPVPGFGYFCYNPLANIPANGGTTSFQIGMAGEDFRLTDEPVNCASIFLYSPEQESCVDVPWSPGQFLWIEKDVVSCNAAGICTFEISVTNQSVTTAYNGPLTIEDTIAPGGGAYVSNTGNFTCSGTGTVNCDSNGNVIIPGGGTLSFDLTLDVSSPLVAEENCVTFTSTYQIPGNEFCVDLPEIPVAPTLSIDKDKLTPGNCMMGSPLGDYQCEYSVTFTNEGPGDFDGPLSFEDVVSLNSPALGPQIVNVNTGPGAPWTCTANNGIPNIICSTGTTDIFIADGDSVTVTFILDHTDTRFDENCVTLETPLQNPQPESCVRHNTLSIEKEKITAGDCMGMGPPPQACEFKITVTNDGPLGMIAPFTVSDVVDGIYGMPIINYSDQTLWNCSSVSSSTDCVYTGPTLMVGDTAELTLILDLAHPAFVEENCVSITDPELFPVPEACVPLEANEPTEFSINKELINCVIGPANTNDCEYEITVTNTGSNSYTGPLSVDDNFTSVSNAYLTGTNSVDGWNCLPLGSAQSFDCDTPSVTLAPNGQTSFTAVFSLAPGEDYENCASTDNPFTGAVVQDCASVTNTPQPGLDIEKIKLTEGNCHITPGGTVSNECEFQIVITNNGPGDFNGDITIDDEFGWGAPITGSSTPVTWTSNPSNPAWTCVSTPTGTECSANGVSIPENGSITLDLTLDHGGLNGGWPVENCATIAEPVQTPMPEDCILIDSPTVEKALVPGQGECWDATTGQFSCEFEFTITRNISSNQTVPYDLTDSMPPLTNMDGTVTSGNWSCSPSNGATEIYCFQNSITGYVDVFTVLITGNSSSAPIENCATLSEVTHIDVIAEVCIDLPIIPSSTGVEVFKELVGPCVDGICEFEITYVNHGPNSLTGPIIVSDTFITVGAANPIFLGTNSADGWTCGYSPAYPVNLNCNLIGFPLSAGQSTSFTVEFDMSAGGDYENCAATWDALNSQTNNDCETVSITQPPSNDNVLTISKNFLDPAGCDPSTVDCDFVITITNLGPDPFSGNLTFNDLITMGGSPHATTVTGVTPASWTCQADATGSGHDCSGSIPSSTPIPVNGSTTLTLTLASMPPIHGNNCVTLTSPSQTPEPFDCIGLDPGSMSYIRLYKEIAADSEIVPPASNQYGFSTSCVGNTTAQTSTVGAGETSIINIGFPSGACTITEDSLPPLSDPNCSWDTPVYSPSNIVTVPQGQDQTVTVTNRISCAPPLDAFIEVGKQYASDTDWRPSNGAVHQLDISCVDASGSVIYTQSEDLNWTGFMGQIPGGTTCTFTEIPDPSDLPVGCIWEPPVYSNGGVEAIAQGGGSVFYIENKAVCQNVNTTDFTIEKSFLNGGSCVNSSSGLCEFLVTITNNGSDYTGPMDFDDLVSAGGYGGGGGIGATLDSYNSNDNWMCSQAGQTVDCENGNIIIPAGGTTEITIVMDIPSGAPNIKNCVQLDYPVQNPLPEYCVEDIDPQARQTDPNGNTGISWNFGPEISVPVGGTFVTGGMINDQPFTSSEDVSFGDVYSSDIGWRLGAEYPVNDNWSLVGGLGYQRFDGQTVSLGTIDGTPLTGIMGDLKQYSFDAGVHYNLPDFALNDRTSLTPYLEGRLGAAYVPEIALTNARLGQRQINNGVIPMYRDSWVPKADLMLGVQFPIENDFTLSIESGLQYSGALRSDNRFFGPGVPLAGTNNNAERWSVPFRLKFGSKF